MKLSNANVDGAAALAAAPASGPFFGIAAALVAALGTGRRIDGTLRQGCYGLRLNLRHGFGGGLLRQGRGNGCNRQRSDLHKNPVLTPTNIYQLSRTRNEEFVNRFGFNVILGKCWQTALSNGLEGSEVRS